MKKLFVRTCDGDWINANQIAAFNVIVSAANYVVARLITTDHECYAIKINKEFSDKQKALEDMQTWLDSFVNDFNRGD